MPETLAQERKRLIREGERRQAIANFYEADQELARAKLQELADYERWETSRKD